jgi:hypothetical protein
MSWNRSHKAILLSFLVNLFSANISPLTIGIVFKFLHLIKNAVGCNYTNFGVSAFIEVQIGSGGRA